MLRKIPNKRPQTRFIKALPQPIKRRAEVIHQLFPPMPLSYLRRKSRRLLHARVRRLEPEQVGEGGVLDCTLCGGRHAGAVVVEAFAGAGDVPREEDGGVCVRGCEGPAAGEGEVAVLSDCGGEFVDFTLGGAFGAEVVYHSWRDGLAFGSGTRDGIERGEGAYLRQR